MSEQKIPSAFEAADAIQFLQEIVRVPSFSREEEFVANLMENKLKNLGFSPKRSKNNLWVRNKHFDPAKKNILLNSHIDTVKPNSGYTRDPFDSSMEDGKLYGLGSNDAGAAVVGLLAAFAYFYERDDLHYNLIFAPTAEEEISGLNGIESLLPEIEAACGKIDCAIVGEPTNMQMAVAEKGLMVLDCKSFGRAGHAARDEGDNAIYKAVKDINWFKDYHFSEVSDLLGPNKMTVTVVQAGSQHNVVPQECNFVVDVRLNEFYSHDQALEEIRKNVTADVQPRSTRIKSTAIELHHPLVRAGTDLGRSHYGSPTTSDKALMKFPALKIGPGESARSHTADEFIFVTEIEEGVELYRALLGKVLLP